MNVSTVEESYRNFTSCPYNEPVVILNKGAFDDDVATNEIDDGDESSLRMFRTFVLILVLVLLYITVS
jgi:hypothetical protein